MGNYFLSFSMGSLLIAGAAAVQREDLGLRLVFQPPDGYTEPVYGRPVNPGFNYSFLEGDPITLRVSVANWGARVRTLKTAGLSLDQAVSVELTIDSGRNRTAERAILRLDPEVFVDGESLRSGVAWGSDVALQPRWYFTAPATLDMTAPLGPGDYRMTLTGVRFGCEPDCAVMEGSGEFRFEVKRVVGLAEELDRHIRRAFQSLALGELADVNMHARRALALYPAASAAYQVLGMKARATGNWTEAADAYERAVALLENGQDSLRPPGAGRIAALESIRRNAEAARAAASRGKR